MSRLMLLISVKNGTSLSSPWHLIQKMALSLFLVTKPMVSPHFYLFIYFCCCGYVFMRCVMVCFFCTGHNWANGEEEKHLGKFTCQSFNDADYNKFMNTYSYTIADWVVKVSTCGQHIKHRHYQYRLKLSLPGYVRTLANSMFRRQTRRQIHSIRSCKLCIQKLIMVGLAIFFFLNTKNVYVYT